MSVEFVFFFFPPHFTQGSRSSSINNKMVELKTLSGKSSNLPTSTMAVCAEKGKKSDSNDKNGEIKSLKEE